VARDAVDQLTVKTVDPTQQPGQSPKDVLGSAEKNAAVPPVNVDLSTHFRLPHFVRFPAPPFPLRFKEYWTRLATCRKAIGIAKIGHYREYGR
jgi:hypothetical protein